MGAKMMSTGAFLFGAVIGWVTYFTMRYSSKHAMTDIATVIGAIGGAAVLALFPAQSDLFAAYGIGLGAGFFIYVLILIVATVRTKGLAGLADEQEKKNPFMGA
jgi:hypothetical protein